MTANWDDILKYWFGTYENRGRYFEEKIPFWFAGKPEVDDEIRQLFGDCLDVYDKGGLPLEVWKSNPRGFLAAIILFDQFPRHIYRGSPRAYSYDLLALSLAREFIPRGNLSHLKTFEKVFAFLPFVHSESRAVQEEGIHHFEDLLVEAAPEVRPNVEMVVQLAHQRLRVIDRFGRNPHRNSTLGRVSTEAEQSFLASTEISF